MHDYKSPRVAVLICATLVNTQTDNFWPVPAVLLAQPAELKTTAIYRLGKGCTPLLSAYVE